MSVELPLLNNVPSNLRELLQSYKEDVDPEGILRVDHFRVGYMLLLHSDAPKRRDYTGTVKTFVNIAEKNGLVNINVAALKSILAKLVTKIDGFKNFKRDYKNICCVCDAALKITRNNLESPVPATPPTPVPVPATPPPPTPDYVPATPPLHVLKNKRSTEPPSCRKRLKTDCDKCEKRCLAIAELKRKNDKKNNILREIRTSQKANKEKSDKERVQPLANKNFLQSPMVKLKRNAQALDRKKNIEVKLRSERRMWIKRCVEKNKENLKLKELLSALKSGKDKADVKALMRSRSKLKSNYKKTLSNKNAEIVKLQARIRELEKELFGLDHTNDILTATILEVQAEKQQLDTIASKSDKKTYGIPYRKAAYHCLSNQVPVETVSGVMNSVVKELTNGTLDGKADKSTISQFSYELGVLSDIQVAEVMVKNDNLTLAWDATSLDGEHINEVHVYIPGDPPKGYVLQISTLPGGTTDDYNEHITNSITDIVATYCALNKKNEMTTLHAVRAHLKNTLCDRVAVNHCVVQKIQISMDIELLQLKCNVHPLDGIASKSRTQLKKFDKDNDLKSDMYGKDCFAANLILGVSKMRYKQGTGDPAGFKLFMKQEGIKPSTMVRYVGNRLHVLFHLAGVITSIHEKLHYYLAKLCACENPLRCALQKDLENPKILVQLRVLGLLGKILTGPWMREFYGNKDNLTNLQTTPLMKTCIESLENFKEDPSALLTTERDVFQQPLEPSDHVLSSLQSSDCSGTQKEDFEKIATLLIDGSLEVLRRQLQPYLEGDLSTPTEEMLAQTTSAPTHNIFAEQTLGLTDHQYRRAPNATIGFIDGKVKSKKNQTLAWLDGHSETEQKRLIRFAIGRARHVRSVRKERDALIQRTLEKRQKQKKMKRDTTARNKLEKKMKDVIDGTTNLNDAFVDYDTEVREAIQLIVRNPDSLVDSHVSHTWCEDDGVDSLYTGKVLRLKETFGYTGSGKSRTKNTLPTYKLEVAYWRDDLNETEDDSEDFWIPLKQALTDMLCGDLIIHN